ncbi:Asp-tRNA(Asn)/Glu-tRNA(Gln) amidotransferase subunit GatC [Tepidimonas taiwanensis]|uniref:Aspartyl/glutamyl-tRNA(Asn/Gln) amidotransferase subunit C n=1 Tax=Tepidimonas taiwanensis TaxID=307486 RepID=A0A554X574_9BURK|nr:Asp-tRNA(Asn)/Glu-tRNA(Gln) amidotransferase subunit GatC [Tepidimonas taiwanensis]MCX7692528.1 Asp-tRNA(Asn)/Glu-tRNA(Gln) amidotransferase subunit GatC [Tepidimonas taiwanensis]MDM7463324.1 Asp-tRNA(Asn)/Glu-tRNA(Gln) amidotransferase subunit GatC [Tepidimonas taiwanensis]TSE30975.1 Glutamyl-tRNA(Gln) amidotransferase subunit C [Tepidimonas taiwanensis]UBQ05816.1 Asp-tRNA(Asn)/Glu-tRNA(Gln) amidotransferase subunit GatC [Tepidimonas taiwanensis]
MSLTLQDVDRLAHLARLALDRPTAERMLGQLNAFFDIVEQMKAVDTTGVTPLAHPAEVFTDVSLRLRDDVVTEPNQREAYQASAPAVEDGLYLVPRVIE